MAERETHLQANQRPGKSKQANPLKLAAMVAVGLVLMGGGFLAQNKLFARGSDGAAPEPVVRGSVEPLVVRDAPGYADLAKREVAPPEPKAEEPDPEAEARRLAQLALQRALEAQRAAEAAAIASPLTFERNTSNLPAPRAASNPKDQLAALSDRLASLTNGGQGAVAEAGSGRPAVSGATNAAGTGLDYTGVVLDKAYLPPASEHLVQAGTLIPAALITGVNSDLPGEIIAQVTEPIHDTPSGNALMIPAGAKLLGRYDSIIGYGQDRAFIIWDRLLMPNGYSIELDELNGTDKKGQAGAADQVDYHIGRLVGAVLLSSFITVGANVVENSDDNGFTDDLGNAAAQQAVGIGSDIVRRQLDVQPTITIRPGWTMRVLVNKDIVLTPYDQL